MQLGLKLIHLDGLHVDLHPEGEHLKIPQVEHSIHVVIAHVQDTEVPEIKGVVLGVLSLDDFGEGDVVATAIPPHPVELLCDVLFHTHRHLMLVLRISHHCYLMLCFNINL